MRKTRTKSSSTDKKQPRGRVRSKGDKFESLTGGEVHGRAGESLSTHEQALVGREPDWQRDENKTSRNSGGDRSAGTRSARNQIIEIEYERGPGSRFQVEGRGAVPRGKRSR